jgi:hypothetical protein
MLDRMLFDWNEVAGLVTAAFVNALPATLLFAAVAWVLMLVQKRWTAASRYWVWWIVLVSVALLPVAQAFLPEHASTFPTEIRRLGAPEKHISGSEIHSFTALGPAPVLRIGNPHPHSTLTIAGLFLFGLGCHDRVSVVPSRVRIPQHDEPKTFRDTTQCRIAKKMARAIGNVPREAARCAWPL